MWTNNKLATTKEAERRELYDAQEEQLRLDLRFVFNVVFWGIQRWQKHSGSPMHHIADCVTENLKDNI